jgi:hypothetical protein
VELAAEVPHRFLRASLKVVSRSPAAAAAASVASYASLATCSDTPCDRGIVRHRPSGAAHSVSHRAAPHPIGFRAKGA